MVLTLRNVVRCAAALTDRPLNVLWPSDLQGAIAARLAWTQVVGMVGMPAQYDAMVIAYSSVFLYVMVRLLCERRPLTFGDHWCS